MKRKTPPTMHVDTPTKIFIKPTPDPELLLGRCGVRNFLRLDLDPLQNSLGTRSTNPLKSTPASNTMKANCPFLGRVSTRFLQHAGRSLSVYSERCPVMSRLLHTNARGSTVNLANSRAPLNMGEINYWFLASSVIVTIILMVICPLGVYIIYIYIYIYASSISCTYTCTITSLCFLTERLYLSIHSSLPRASISSAGQCPFHGLSREFSSTAGSNQKPVGQQPPTPHEGIMPKGTSCVADHHVFKMTFCYLSASTVGNCPFRWSDLITNTLKSKIEKIVPPTTSPPRVDYGMPLTG